MTDLPTRPPNVLPCQECGGKRGHVPGCEAGSLQSSDWSAQRVRALKGRIVDSVLHRSRDSVRITFTDGVWLDVDYRQVDFATRAMALTVGSPKEGA